MLAQAQACFYEKCVGESKSNAVCMKVAAECAALYGGVAEYFGGDLVRKYFPSIWISLTQVCHRA